MRTRNPTSERPIRTADPVRTGAAPAPVDGDWIVGRVLLLVFVCSLLYAIWTASVGWGNTLNDRHSFRQTQTATTAYYMIGQPFKLAYETPVLGKPWAIPMEFPLYQWIVARIVGLFGTPLDQTGRFVSLVFFLLTTIPLYRLVRSLGVAAHHAWVPLILFVTSPFYIFWSRTFMIESTALFFAVAYLAAAVEAIQGGGARPTIVAIVCGVLAALIKVTTFLVFLAPVSILAAGAVWWTLVTGLGRVRPTVAIARLAMITLIPFLAGVAWVKFSSDVRSLNPIAAEYITGQRQIPWNFGTWDQKVSLEVWSMLFDRSVMLLGYPAIGWLLLGASMAILMLTARRRTEALACLACYVLGPLVFTNLYVVHDYYANANGVFLIGIVAFAIIAVLEDRPHRAAAWTLVALAVGGAAWGHRLMFMPWQSMPNGEILQAAEYIRSATPEDSVIVCVGPDWSPLVPYYAQRRALMISIDPAIDPRLVERAIASLEGEKVAAIVAIDPMQYPLQRARQQLQDAGFDVPVLSVKGLPFR